MLSDEYSSDELKGLLESVLFITGKPVSADRLCAKLNLSFDFLSKLVVMMNEQYEALRSGFCILRVAGGYQLVTNPRYHKAVKNILTLKDDDTLSQAAMEVLSIIAYQQPVSKQIIDKIRGMNSSRGLRILLLRKLVAPISKDNILDDVLYGTTSRFLEVLHINDLSELPSLKLFD